MKSRATHNSLLLFLAVFVRRTILLFLLYIVACDAINPAPLDAVLLSSSFPYASFCFVLGNASGTIYSRAVGGFNLSAGVSVASSSKWVSQMLLSLLMSDGTLAPNMTTRGMLGGPWGALPPDDPRGTITLASLMSFTSGMNDSVPCAQAFAPPGATPSSCAADLLAGQLPLPLPPTAACPASFYYAGSHQMLAGYMAVAASGAAGWNALFTTRLARPMHLAATTLYTPLSNPHPAGGLYISANDYALLLRAYFAGDLLGPAAVSAIETDHTHAPGVCIASEPLAPAYAWHYGWGQWLECRAPGSVGLTGTWQPSCDAGCAHSSIGLYGTYPYIDRCTGYWAILVVANGTALVSAEIGETLWPAAIAALGGGSSGSASASAPPSATPTPSPRTNGTIVGGGDSLQGTAPAVIGAAVGGAAAALLFIIALTVIVILLLRRRRTDSSTVPKTSGAPLSARPVNAGSPARAAHEVSVLSSAQETLVLSPLHGHRSRNAARSERPSLQAARASISTSHSRCRDVITVVGTRAVDQSARSTRDQRYNP